MMSFLPSYSRPVKMLFASVTIIVSLSSFAKTNNLQQAIPLPGGNYQTSCTNINYDGTMLTALCPNSNGQKFSAILYYPTTCDSGSTVSNTNGVLTCDAFSSSLPPGSYMQSCDDILYESGTLSAQCLQWNDNTGDATLISSSIVYPGPSCRNGSIINHYGYLSCQYPE